MIRRLEDAEGWRVLDEGLQFARTVFGSRLVGAYALGSLAHGGFAPAASDVDLALILDKVEDAGDDERMAEIRDHVRRHVDSPLAERLSVFWSSWADLERQTGAGRFPLADRQDLAMHGHRLLGEDLRARVVLPEGDELHRALVVETARFFLDRLARPDRDARLRDPAALVALGCREATKAVLFPVRFLYTLETGAAAGNGEAVAMLEQGPPGPIRDLAIAALAWREAGDLGPAARARALLGAGMLPLHDAFASRYARALIGFGETALAFGLGAWNARLQSPDA